MTCSLNVWRHIAASKHSSRPAPDRIDRIVRAAQRAHLDRFRTAVYERLSPAAHWPLDELLLPETDEGEQSVAGENGR